MTDFVICVLTNLFRVYLISRFIKVFFSGEKAIGDAKNGIDYRNLLRCFLYVCFFLVNTAAYLAFHRMVVNILCNLIGIGLIVLTYTRSLKMNLFVTGSVYLINMGCDTIAVFLFVNYRDGESFDQIYEVITVFLILICELVTEKIVNTRRHQEGVRNSALCMVPLCSIGIFCAAVYTDSVTEKGIVIINTGLLLINFLVYYLYNMMSNMMTMEYENRTLRQRVQNYAEQMDILLRGEEKVKALRHDMKHHLCEIKILASQNKNGAIEEYINDMEGFIGNPDEIVSSGNAEMDSVMNYMLRRAKRELHTVNVNVQLPDDVGHVFDLNVILGNLMENAIDAAALTEEKFLDFSVEMKQGFLRLQIENSYRSEALRREQGRLLSSKAGEGLHGIGLENVRKIVEKYNGKMDVDPGEKRFCVTLILYMPEIE